jgi:hypothetical protein
MKLTTSLKTLAMLGLTTLTLATGSSQANGGFVTFGSNANTWASHSAVHQTRYQAEMKHRQAQLDQRQDAQMQRILKGMDNGKLTSREAADLLREHLAIANMERNFLVDGRLGANELAHLEKRLDIAAKNIKWEIRDRERMASLAGFEDPRKLGTYGSYYGSYHERDDRRDNGRPGR